MSGYKENIKDIKKKSKKMWGKAMKSLLGEDKESFLDAEEEGKSVN